MKHQLKRVLKYLSFLVLCCVIIYIWKYLPIISGHVAKELCSGIFISGRTAGDIADHETGIFPYNAGRVQLCFLISVLIT
jgi:hypothetical protein